MGYYDCEKDKADYAYKNGLIDSEEHYNAMEELHEQEMIDIQHQIDCEEE